MGKEQCPITGDQCQFKYKLDPKVCNICLEIKADEKEIDKALVGIRPRVKSGGNLGVATKCKT